MSRYHYRRPTDWACEYEHLRLESADVRQTLRARVVLARRWHYGAIQAIDGIWAAAIQKLDGLTFEHHEAEWAKLERDLGPYMAGVPGQGESRASPE